MTRQAQRFVVAVLGVLGAINVFVHLDVQSWHIDELAYRDAGTAQLAGDFSLFRNSPPVSKFIIGAAHVAFGESRVAVRAPMAAMSLMVAAGLFVLARRLAGFGAGAAATAVYLLLPHAPPGQVGRLERMAALEVPMYLGLVIAAYAAWRLGEDGRRRWAALAGAAFGFAVASKHPVLLAAPGLALPLLWAPLRHRERVARAVLLCGAAVLTLGLCYAPAGSDAFALLRDNLDWTFGRAASAHPLVIAGTVYQQHPWWSHLWFIGASITWPALAALGALVVASWWAPARAAVFIAGLGALPVVVDHLSAVKMPHYHLAWSVQLALAAGVGAGVLMRRARTPNRGGVAACLLAATVGALAVPAVTLTSTMLRLAPNDYAAAEKLIVAAGHARGPIVANAYGPVLAAYLPGADLRVATPDRSVPPPTVHDEINVVVIDTVIEDRFPAPSLRAAVARGFDHYVFDQVEVYLRRTPHRAGAPPGAA